MEKLANTLTNYYLKKKVIAEDKYEIYLYGFKLIIADIINYMIIIALGIILKKFPESITFLLSLCVLRQFTGGFHAKTFWLCRISMVITYIGVLLITNFVLNSGFEIPIIIFISVATIMVIAIFAPIENVNKRLSKSQRKSNKLKSIIASIILSMASVVFVVENTKVGVTISITMLATIVLMFVAMAIKKGGNTNLCRVTDKKINVCIDNH